MAAEGDGHVGEAAGRARQPADPAASGGIAVSHATFLAEASALLASSLDYETTLQSVARMAVPRLADWCGVDLYDEDGTVQPVAVAHVDPERVVWAQELRRRYPPDPRAPSGVLDVLRSGLPYLVPEVTDEMLVASARDAAHLDLLRQAGFYSLLIVPLVAGGRTLGALSMVAAESGRRYGQEELVLAMELARRAALAVDHARLYREAEDARLRAERLQAVTAGLSAALTPEEVAHVIVEEGLAAFGVDAGAIYALDEDGTTFNLLGYRGYARPVAPHYTRVRTGVPGPLAEALSTGELIAVESPEEMLARWPALAAAQAQSGDAATAAAPLLLDGRALGVLYVAFRRTRRFSPADRAFLLTLARQCAQALEHARLYRQAQEARDEAAARADELEAILDAVADAVCVYDREGRLVRANAPAHALATGDPRIDTPHRPLDDGIALAALRDERGHPLPREQWPQYRVLAGAVLTGAQAVEIRTLNGEERFLSVSGAPIRDASGRIVGAVCLYRDVTERRRLEREAAERASQLAAVFDAIGDGIIVYDRDRRVLRANAAARLFNPWLDQAAYRGRPFEERASLATPRTADGRLLPAAEWPVSRLLRGEVLTGNEAVDMLLLQPDGREALLNVSGAPLRDPQGQIVGAVIVNRDVTERRLLEGRTRAALEALLQMAQAVVVAPGAPDDHEADTAHVIAQRLVELTRQVLGCERISLTAIDPESGLQHSLAVVGLNPEQEQALRAVSEGVPLAEAQRQIAPDHVARFMAGEIVIADMTQPPYDEQPNPLGLRTVLVAPLQVGQDIIGILSYDYGGVAHDYGPEEVALAEGISRLAALVLERDRLVREREEARAHELALWETNRRMEAFLAVASHELRTPLASIRGSLQLLQRRLDRAAVGTEGAVTDLAALLGRLWPLLSRAVQQTGVLGDLVDDLVDMARIEAGELRLHLAPCDLAALVAQAVEEQRELVAPRTIGLHLPAGANVRVQGDADRLEQVVRNYLSNALKYSAEDQPVTVGLEVEGERARVWVRDEGPGVPIAEQERIWDRFSRVETTGHRSGSSIGLGLGLYISRTIITRHGGQVGVESVPGEGATFWFTLPLAGTSQP